jgi:putative transcriptional regulator
MKQELFNELLESIRQAGEIRKGKQVASRMNIIEDPDVRQIRDSYDMSQDQFASLLGISVATLRNWEQGRRKPQGPAKVLLRVAAKRPKAILESL